MDDKVTLEWLMRFEGAVRQDTPRGIASYTWVATPKYGSYDHENGLIGFTGTVFDDSPSHITVAVRGLCESFGMSNPTIARFHEAVAFLGATLPPLRSKDSQWAMRTWLRGWCGS
jgi:hypothetical protein